MAVGAAGGRHPHDPQLVGPTRLDRVVEVVLTAGLLASALLLVAGLVTARPGPLWWGLLALLLTPMARVIVVAIGFFDRRDWAFALVSLWILGVLCFSFFVAARL